MFDPQPKDAHMDIYLASSLTHVPRTHFAEYTKSLHLLARGIMNEGRNRVKYALVNSDPQLASKPLEERARLCYLWDSKMVQDSDVVVAECSFPSLGLGIELQLAVEHEIPCILLFRDFFDNRAAPVNYINPDLSEHQLQIGEGFISLMALGLPTVFKVLRYLTVEDGISQTRDSLDLLDHNLVIR